MKAIRRHLLVALLAGLCAWSGAAIASGFIDNPAIVDQIRPGVTTADEVRKLLGAPANVLKFPSQGVESLEYDTHGQTKISISIGKDGKVRDVVRRRLSF
jgi:outer membrane protein assembly factor BamE (lipoprotein component of BamABCDE complex)